MDAQQIEKQIRDLLDTEKNGWILSDKLFGPDGLFGQLGPTLEDRKRIGQSPLFKEAQKRIREFERKRAQLLRDEMKNMRLGVGQTKQV
jgi:hypothetical protein